MRLQRHGSTPDVKSYKFRLEMDDIIAYSRSHLRIYALQDSVRIDVFTVVIPEIQSLYIHGFMTSSVFFKAARLSTQM